MGHVVVGVGVDEGFELGDTGLGVHGWAPLVVGSAEQQ